MNTRNLPLGLARIIHHGPAATAATGPSTALWGPPASCHVGYSYAQSAVHPTPCTRTGFHALATARHELSGLVLACLLLAGCSSSSGSDTLDNGSDTQVPPDGFEAVTPDSGPETSAPTCLLDPEPATPDPLAPVALFRVMGENRVTPFPFDIFTRPGPTPGGRSLDLTPPASIMVDGAVDFMGGFLDAHAALAEVDGFSVVGPIMFPFSAPLDHEQAVEDPRQPAGTTSVFLLRISPEDGACSAPIPAFLDIRDVDDGGDVQGLAILRPYVPLEPGTRYLAGISRAFKSAAGIPGVADAHFRSLVSDPDALAGPDSPQSAAARELLASVEPCLASLDPPMCPGDLAVATVFTTRDATAPLRSARDRMILDSPLEVTLERDDEGNVVVYSPGDLPSAVPGQDMSASSVAIRGSFDVPDYRGQDGDVHIGPEGMPEPSGSIRIPFVLLLPADPDLAPFRLVVMAHGHSGSKERVAHLAKRFGEQGLALAAIDAPGHGELTGNGGFPIASLPVSKGSFAQAEVNLIHFLAVVQALDTLDVFPPGQTDGLPDLDISEGIGFIGESLGALTGAPAAALEPAVRATVLNVGGGGLTNAAPDTVEPILSGAGTLVYWGLKALLQPVVDTFDPIAFTGPLSAHGTRSILMQAVVGDTAFDGAPTVDLARALDIPSVCPCPRELPLLATVEAPYDGSGLFYYDNASHGFLLANNSNPAASDAVRRQAAHFIRTALDGGPGKIVDFQ